MTNYKDLLALSKELKSCLDASDRLGLHLASISICEAIDKVARAIEGIVPINQRTLKEE